MSAIDDVFTIEGPESYNQPNGDIREPYNRNRATLEKIKSVHENPFFIQLGIKHSVPAHSSVKSESSYSEKSLEEEDDTEITYRPGSGFVHRLLDKYKSLTARGESVSRLKKASSLDELTADNDGSINKSVTFKEPASNGTATVFADKPSHLSTSRLSKSHKAKSVEVLNDVPLRPSPSSNHSLTSSYRLSGTKWSRDKSTSSLKNEAPDVELARDDIIIIEKTPPVQTHKETSGPETDGSLTNQTHHHEDLPGDDLPRPNTVLTVRTIFESASASNTNELLSRRRRLDSGAFSPLSTTAPNLSLNTDGGQVSPSITNHGLNMDRTSVHSPSPVTSPRLLHPETYAKSVLLPHPVVTSSVEHPKSSHNSPVAANISVNNSSSLINHNDSEADSKPSVLERSSYFGSSKSNSSSRPRPTPRNTASVKPTIVQKPSAPVKPLPISAPASAATSYKKSSPVVPVAPFKDKQEDAKDDGQPVMIFNKSKLSPRREKPQRVKNYESVGEVQVHSVKDLDEKSVIISNDTKKIFQKDENKIINNKVFSQSKIFKSSNDLNMSRSMEDKEESSSNNSLKLKPSTKLSMAPNPPDQSVDRKHENDSSKSEDKTDSVSVNSDASFNHKSNEKPNSPSSHQPVKGIPSIIAQRLKKQTSDPSQVAVDVVSSFDSADGNRKSKFVIEDPGADNDAPSSKKRVTPLSIVLTNVDNTSSKDSISSEVENEIAAVRKKMEGSRSKSTNVSQIFDSSQLTKKRKENQKQRDSQNLVPRLDLSGINDENEYQPVQTEIKPCNIIFIGENAKTERSLLVKSRRSKISIQFNDSKTETFEYPSEEFALEKYLEEHPNEPLEMVILDDMNDAESSDDGPETPRRYSDDDGLKSNTSLSSTGNLQSYKHRFQEEFQFGLTTRDREPEPVARPEEPPADPDALMLRPAEEVDTWSTNDSSDLLF